MTLTLEALAARIEDGSSLAIAVDRTGLPVALTLALIRRGVRGLHVITVPTGGLPVDLLIGAGAVATVETSAVSLGEFGPAPRFAEAVRSGAVRVIDATCPAVYAGLEAAERGVPFLPMRGLIGSDILAHHPGWRVIDNPFAAPGPDPIALVAAIRPDTAIFHARWADAAGNVWIGRHRELMLMAHASRQTLVTVERVVDFDLIDRVETAPGTIPAGYVDGIAVVARGAAPTSLDHEYEEDAAFLAEYAREARSEAGFRRLLGQLMAGGLRDAA